MRALSLFSALIICASWVPCATLVSRVARWVVWDARQPCVGAVALGNDEGLPRSSSNFAPLQQQSRQNHRSTSALSQRRPRRGGSRHIDRAAQPGAAP
eukprot:scaffold2534_cov260-Pinguiococcus_pyrenoidosus.AAC.7